MFVENGEIGCILQNQCTSSAKSTNPNAVHSVNLMH